jgi:hypothetical protein
MDNGTLATPTSFAVRSYFFPTHNNLKGQEPVPATPIETAHNKVYFVKWGVTSTEVRKNFQYSSGRIAGQ